MGSKIDSTKDSSIWTIVDRENGRARLLGYKDIYELIGDVLHLRNFSRGNTLSTVIGIPIPAQIAEMSLAGSFLKVKIKKAPSLGYLQLNAMLERQNPRTAYYERIFRKPKLVRESKESPEHEFSYVEDSIQLSNMRSDDRIEVELINRKLPAFSMDSSSLIVPLQNVVEPFARLLSGFCSLDLFKQHLLNPELSKKSARVFENAVAWLLSLMGYSVVLLGEYENLDISDTKYRVGSVDLIAQREGENLLLIDCDTSMPDERKIRSMIGMVNHFKHVFGERRQSSIAPVLFSPKDCTGISDVAPDAIFSQNVRVRIADRHVIESIFVETLKGNSKRARSILVYW